MIKVNAFLSIVCGVFVVMVVMVIILFYIIFVGGGVVYVMCPISLYSGESKIKILMAVCPCVLSIVFYFTYQGQD